MITTVCFAGDLECAHRLDQEDPPVRQVSAHPYSSHLQETLQCQGGNQVVLSLIRSRRWWNDKRVNCRKELEGEVAVEANGQPVENPCPSYDYDKEQATDLLSFSEFAFDIFCYFRSREVRGQHHCCRKEGDKLSKFSQNLRLGTTWRGSHSSITMHGRPSLTGWSRWV